MRIFITGVTGFIGGQLAHNLSAAGHEVAGFARLTSKPEADLPVRLYRGSLIDRESIRWSVRDFQPEAVLHLGAITQVSYSFDHPQEVVETNLLGTINLAEACRLEVPSLKRFIFASSMEVYGRQIDWSKPFVETLDPLPACPYAVAKLAAEKYLKYLGMAYRFPWVALRQTNCYGREHDDRFIVEALVTRMLKGGTVEAGDPRPIRNFIYISDLLEVYRRLLTVPFETVSHEVYNTGPDNGLAIHELAAKIAAITGWSGGIYWNRLPPRPGEVFYLNSTNAKLVERIGNFVWVGLDEGLRRVVANWKKKLVPRCVA